MADDKKISGDDGFIRTIGGVREAFDGSDKGGQSGISSNALSTIMYGSTVGLVLVLAIFVVLSNSNSGDAEERQANVIRAIVFSLILFSILMVFIGVVVVTS